VSVAASGEFAAVAAAGVATHVTRGVDSRALSRYLQLAIELTSIAARIAATVPFLARLRVSVADRELFALSQTRGENSGKFMRKEAQC